MNSLLTSLFFQAPLLISSPATAAPALALRAEDNAYFPSRYSGVVPPTLDADTNPGISITTFTTTGCPGGNSILGESPKFNYGDIVAFTSVPDPKNTQLFDQFGSISIDRALDANEMITFYTAGNGLAPDYFGQALGVSQSIGTAGESSFANSGIRNFLDELCYNVPANATGWMLSKTFE